MTKLSIATAAIFVVAATLFQGSGGPVGAQQFDCAHGPDTYRVRNVESWDVLNIRTGPTARARIVGTIPPHGSGVHCLGPCSGAWCRISWRGIVGWTNMRYLGE